LKPYFSLFFYFFHILFFSRRRRLVVSPTVMVHEPAVLIEGVLFRANYLGSTQIVCEGQPTKYTRMMQAEEAVSRIKVKPITSPSIPFFGRNFQYSITKQNIFRHFR
jgi:hypothetical protein